MGDSNLGANFIEKKKFKHPNRVKNSSESALKM